MSLVAVAVLFTIAVPFWGVVGEGLTIAAGG